MLFRAVVDSPLGAILLEADEAGLTGLYFTDQRDCPTVAGVGPAPRIVSDPSAGRLAGRPIRSFRAQRVPPQGSGDLFANGSSVSLVARDAAEMGPLRFLQNDTPGAPAAVLRQTHQELHEYWRGDRKVFDVPLSLRGTDFQKKVWAALLEVSFGATLSYGELGEQAGLGTGHGRAVGTAVGSNPVSIIVPCHRILARDHSLNGYGGGLRRKVRLLQLEGLGIV
ncbi:methylated-DNA--[protein]-cysteine S-methyltransferase [Castellaniella sp.]|uniref:methylated-DNA--[protein]-cysteine S-methyltransferase n=1 Tax=Castellaniella sp. TaxID=1955812 RepID=UPI0025C4A41F|nr:methylated-DNA--[protein]-cysteine S-methyltransferase [Castellaniella sp.]